MKKVRSVLFIILLLSFVALPVLAICKNESNIKNDTQSDAVDDVAEYTLPATPDDADYSDPDDDCTPVLDQTSSQTDTPESQQDMADQQDVTDENDPYDLTSMTIDELAALLDELHDLRPETEEAEHQKWADIAAVKNELVARAIESDYHYTEQVTFDTLYFFIDNRLIRNEKIIYVTLTHHSAEEAEATIVPLQQETERIEAFKETLPQSGDDAYSYWQYYWDEVIHETAPSEYIP